MPQRFEISDDPTINEETYIEAIGRSYDSAFERLGREVLEGDATPEPLAPADDPDVITFEIATSQQEFTSNMKATASAKASFGFGKASAKAKFKQFFNSNSYSCYLIAYRRLIKPRLMLNFREAEIIQEIMKYIDENHDNPQLIQRELGDEVVTGVSIGAELLVKMEVQTSSEEQQKEFKSSLKVEAGKASGKGSFSSFEKAVKGSKSVSFMALGSIPGVVKEVTLEEAEDMILNLPTSVSGDYRYRELHTRTFTEHRKLIGYRIVNLDELLERQEFLSAANTLYQDFLDWENDILYVIADVNKGEFSQEAIEAAKKDYQYCTDRLKRILDMVNAAWTYWKKTGENGDQFRMSRLADGRALSAYPRLMPRAAPAPTSVPAPVRVDRDRRQPGDGQGGRGGQGVGR